MVDHIPEHQPTPRLTRQQKGKLGEQAACRWLQEHDYEIVAQNWRCRSGEIDIVATFEELVIFVEVRSRSGVGRYGTPQESVDFRKVQQVRSTAAVYMQRTGELNRQIRFDVIAVMQDATGEAISLEHIVNAF
ncbi:YraN family protein [Paenibacillus sp. ACRSA]|uniref:YraN family protein n=1 Tax=Paenibacillus sp. ACRSA TaxID=2918211 RepID=UPI001EF4A000|nr:YraN family protein [Paenibacillus sp. ACRSA]MCG7376951.1 YraN family protein [Paenibacillus sp. ACRSA]